MKERAQKSVELDLKLIQAKEKAKGLLGHLRSKKEITDELRALKEAEAKVDAWLGWRL